MSWDGYPERVLRQCPGIPDSPRISGGVSDADIAAYGQRCYMAGKRKGHADGWREYREKIQRELLRLRKQARTSAAVGALRRAEHAAMKGLRSVGKERW